jgi:hypothetical protein
MTILLIISESISLAVRYHIDNRLARLNHRGHNKRVALSHYERMGTLYAGMGDAVCGEAAMIFLGEILPGTLEGLIEAVDQALLLQGFGQITKRAVS